MMRLTGAHRALDSLQIALGVRILVTRDLDDDYLLRTRVDDDRSIPYAECALAKLFQPVYMAANGSPGFPKRISHESKQTYARIFHKPELK
jgi:hypothetical protein